MIFEASKEIWLFDITSTSSQTKLFRRDGVNRTKEKIKIKTAERYLRLIKLDITSIVKLIISPSGKDRRGVRIVLFSGRTEPCCLT